MYSKYLSCHRRPCGGGAAAAAAVIVGGGAVDGEVFATVAVVIAIDIDIVYVVVIVAVVGVVIVVISVDCCRCYNCPRHDVNVQVQYIVCIGCYSDSSTRSAFRIG